MTNQTFLGPLHLASGAHPRGTTMCAMTCSRDEYRAACNAVARERDDAVRDLAIAEDELRTLRAHRCGLPASIIEALNSGDGTYRP